MRNSFKTQIKRNKKDANSLLNYSYAKKFAIFMINQFFKLRFNVFLLRWGKSD